MAALVNGALNIIVNASVESIFGRKVTAIVGNELAQLLRKRKDCEGE